MKGLLKLRLKKQRTVPAIIKEVLFNKLDSEKYDDLFAVNFKVNSLNNVFTVQNAWLLIDDKKVVKNLWLRGEATNISKLSNLGILMEYYNIHCLEDFVDMEVRLFPNYDGYLSLVGCPIDHNVFKNNIKKEDLYK